MKIWITRILAIIAISIMLISLHIMLDEGKTIKNIYSEYDKKEKTFSVNVKYSYGIDEEIVNLTNISENESKTLIDYIKEVNKRFQNGDKNSVGIIKSEVIFYDSMFKEQGESGFNNINGLTYVKVKDIK